MKKKITISVIIPVHNGENHINKSFEALIKQDFTEPYEIIIIDDASTDNSRQVVENFVKLLPASKRQKFDLQFNARNQKALHNICCAVCDKAPLDSVIVLP